MIRTSQNGKNEYKAWTQPLSGLKDSSKSWEKKELEDLSKALLDQIKKNPKNLIDWQSTGIKDKFPSTITPEMIKFKQHDLIIKKFPEVELVANIDSNSKDDVKGTLSFSLEIRNKKGGLNKAKYKIANNILLSTDDGLLALDDLTSKLTIDDLDLPEDIKDKLPSKFEDDIVLKKDSVFKKKYPNVKLIRVSKPNDENDDPNGIKNISFKLKYDHKESSKVANLSINKFYSTKQFDALCNSLTIDDLKINVDSDLSPSEYNVDNIQLKKDSPLLSINANLIISQTELVLADDQNGNLDIKVILADKINKCTYSKNLKIAGFYSILKHKKQVEEFANSLSRYSFLPTRRKLHRLSNYDTNLIRFNEKDNDTFKEITKKVDFKYIWEPNVNGDEEIAFIRFIFTAKNKKFSVEKVVGPYGGFYKTGDIYTIDYEYLCKFCWYMMMSAESSNAKDPDLIRYHNYYWLFNNGKISKEEIERRLNCLIRDQNAIWRINKIYYDNPKNDEEKKHKEDGEKLIQKIDSCPHLRAKIIWWSDNSDYENYVCFGFQLVNSIEGKPDYDYDEKTPIIKIWAKKDHAFGTVKQSKDQL